MEGTPKLSPARLAQAFATDLAAVWQQFALSKPAETPYAFVLYGLEGGHPHLTPVVLTEESLSQAAERYIRLGHYDTLEEARRGLRYSVADSPHVTMFDTATPNVDAEFKPHAQRLGDDKGYEVLAAAAMEALQELDANGLFGQGAAREKILVIIITEDVAVDWSIPSAKKLNPPAVSEQFEKATTIEGDFASCSALTISADGASLYATGSRKYRGEKVDGKEKSVSEIIAFDLRGAQLARRWTFQFPTVGDSGREVALTPDERFLLVLRAQYQNKICHSLIMRFAVDSDVALQTEDVTGEPASFSLAHDGSAAAIAMRSQKVQFLGSDLRPTRESSLPCKIHGTRFLKSGELLVAGDDGVFKMDPHSSAGQLILPQRAHRLSLSGDERLLAVSRWFDPPGMPRSAKPKEPFGVHLFDFPALRLLTSFDVPGHQCVRAELSPDGKLLALEARDVAKSKNWLIVFDVATRRELARRKIKMVNDFHFFADARRIAIAESGFTTTEAVKIWNLQQDRV
jgi:hypothetical protein